MSWLNPQTRAEALLQDVLTQEEWGALQRTGKVYFTGSLGTPFVLYRERTVDQKCERWRRPHTFNLGIVGQQDPSYGAHCFVYLGQTLPVADELVMLYLTAKYAEEHIRAIKRHHTWLRWGPIAKEDGAAELPPDGLAREVRQRALLEVAVGPGVIGGAKCWCGGGAWPVHPQCRGVRPPRPLV